MSKSAFQCRAKTGSMPRGICYVKGCVKQPTFSDEKGLKSCGTHKTTNMVIRLDGNSCYAKGCNKHFSWTDGKGLKACTEHKTENMVSRRGHVKKSAKKTTLKRLKKRKTKSRTPSVSSIESDSCSSCSSVTSNSSHSIASRAEKIGKVWQTNKGTLFSSLFFVA